MRGLAACLVLAAVLAGVLYPVLSVEPPGLFVFTDRMVYGRPAEVTVFGIVLDGEGRPVPRANVSVDVLSPEGDLVYSAEVMTGRDGKFSSSFSLSSSASEGQYEVLAADLDGVYGSSQLSFEVCSACAIPPPTVTVSTTILRTTVIVSTFTRNVTWLETVFSTLSAGQIVTITSFSMVNGSVVTVEVTKYLSGGFDSSYLFYVGLGMVLILALASAIVARRIGPANRCRIVDVL